jgi:deoxyribose-phosphate aldolase
MRAVITARDVPTQGELRVAHGAILTPSAQDLAKERGVKIVEMAQDEAPAPAAVERTIAVGSDHGGFEMKQKLLAVLEETGFAVRDVGVHHAETVDYPDIARQIAELVASGAAALGMIVDGAGIGSAMVANKFPGVRAALCYDKASARNSREHNHANVLTLGGRLLTQTQAEDVLRTWLATPVGGSRHAARVEKIKEIEKANMDGNRSELKPARRGAEAPELDRLVAEIAEEVLARSGGNAAFAPGSHDPIPEAHCTAEACAKMLGAGAARIAPNAVLPADTMSEVGRDIAAAIDHTLLRPDATASDIRKVCQEARKYSFASVCVNPYWVPLVAAELAGSPVKVCTVVGFPLGASATAIKVAETEAAVRVGAQEIDMVLNIGELRGGNYDAVRQDIQAVVKAAHAGSAIVKVILETALLDDNQKAIGCTLSKLAGAEFVKTSTGFSTHGATVHDVALMRQVVGAEMGVKASGGVRTLEDVKQMTAAGATRIGASASVKIIEAAGN